MTRQHPLVTVILSTLAFTLLGGLVGHALGNFAPGYYRAVFEDGHSPFFNPAQVGLGLGITQGMTSGAIIGVVLVVVQGYFALRREAAAKSTETSAYTPDWDDPRTVSR